MTALRAVAILAALLVLTFSVALVDYEDVSCRTIDGFEICAGPAEFTERELAIFEEQRRALLEDR